MAFGETSLVSSLELSQQFHEPADRGPHHHRRGSREVRHGQMASVSLHAGNEVRLGAEVLDEQCQRPETYLPGKLVRYTR